MLRQTHEQNALSVYASISAEMPVLGENTVAAEAEPDNPNPGVESDSDHEQALLPQPNPNQALPAENDEHQISLLNLLNKNRIFEFAQLCCGAHIYIWLNALWDVTCCLFVQSSDLGYFYLRRSCLGKCKEVGETYHRTDTSSRVTAVSEILQRLALVLTNVRTATMTPARQVHEAGLIFTSNSGLFHVYARLWINWKMLSPRLLGSTTT